MILTGSSQQRKALPLYDASGTVTSGGTAQLIVPMALTRSSLMFVNNSDTAMYLEIGAARAAATLSSGTVSSVAVTNAGFGYSKPPLVTFKGGGNTGWNQSNPTFLSATLPDYPSPDHPAKAHCVMTGSAGAQTVASIVVDDPGSGYATQPYVELANDPNDPIGCAVPSASAGIYIAPNGGSYCCNGVACTTDAIAVYCATTGKAFTFKWTL
ncbi:MAG: hypothetical protein EPO08_20915 [Rhodospirillaceae bacterium]|nr:MAG: hypothetical protein EPO08_20915 [Rhodospirillaceae bacterium]